jgi:hypothetical protein
MVTLVYKKVWHHGRLITVRIGLVVAMTLHTQHSSFRLCISSNMSSCSEESWRIGEGIQRGGEWEPIKISHRNLTYIPSQTRRPSLLTRPGPHSYRTAIDHRNRVRNRSGNTNQCQQEHMWDQWQKSDQRTLYILTVISPNNWWTRSGSHRGSAIQTRKPRAVWSNDSRAITISPYKIYTQSITRICLITT